MSKSIQKPSDDSKLSQINEPHVGDIYHHSGYFDSGVFYKIKEFKKIEKVDAVIFLVSTDGVVWEDDERHKWVSLSDLRHYQKLHLAPNETPAQAIQSLTTEMIEQFLNPKDEDDDEETDESASTDLMVINGKERYEDMAISLERAQARAEIIKSMVERRVQSFKNKVNAIQKQLNKVMKVIAMLESYLGVYEEVFQLTEGQPAEKDVPVAIRQLILYMDEEAGLVDVYRERKGGSIHFEGFINFQNIDKFDQWLLKDNHIDQVLPEKKGIIALRPSRQDHYKQDDFWTKINKQAADKMVYLLIRNGDNLYRICTDMHMGKTLFPTLEEAAHIEELFEKSDTSRDREKAEDAQSSWLHNTLLIQGLFDRTTIFQPLPVARVELTNPATFDEGGQVKLIRDAEMVIGDGHESFANWRNALNRKATRGTRIYFPGLSFEKREGRGSRFPNFYSYRDNYPPFPASGIYTVEEVKTGDWTERYHFKYLPDDKLWTYDRWEGFNEHDRKKRYMFSVYSDEFINYDEFTIGDIDYFLRSRTERADYLNLIPTLIGLRSMRLEELKQEKAFVKLLSSKHGIPEKRLWELVDWWKKKVINKRPLSEDDAKAWRMIIKKAKGDLKDE